MLIDIFLFFIIAIIGIIGSLLNALSFIIPDQFETSLISLLSNFKYAFGILPVAELFEVVAFLISFFVVWYTVKTILKVFGMIPFIGKNVKLK